MKNTKIEDLTHELLKHIGENPSREGLLRTPSRVAKAWEFFSKGYKEDLNKVINYAIFNEKAKDMVIVQNVEFFSLCEHHLLPFFGKAHVAYIPNGKIVGLSKIPRIVDVFSRRLQVQERLTVQIKNTIDKVLEPHGVAVVIEAQHLCMMMRGVQKQNSSTTTSSFSGEFEKQATRMEFLKLLSNDLR